MLGEGSERKHQSNAKQGRKANSHVAPDTDWVDGAVAFGGVDEASIGVKQNGLVRRIRQIALGVVGQGAVAVVRVVPVVERREVEMDAPKHGVRAVVAVGEGQQVPSVEDFVADHGVRSDRRNPRRRMMRWGCFRSELSALYRDAPLLLNAVISGEESSQGRRLSLGHWLSGIQKQSIKGVKKRKGGGA